MAFSAPPPPYKEVFFQTEHSNVIGIQILNPIVPRSTEQIVLYDYQRVYESKVRCPWRGVGFREPVRLARFNAACLRCRTSCDGTSEPI